jgi:hypothetical protein
MASNYIPGSENISNFNKKVGINTLNPEYTLDVSGTINFTNQLLQNGNPFIPSILPTGTNYGDYIYWDGTGTYLVGNTNIKLGANAGQNNQGTGSIAIGVNAGSSSQGEYSVAIGYNAGDSLQPANSIILNANSTSLNATTEGLFVNPVRNVYNSDILVYNNSTSEISYTNVTTLLQTGPRGPTGAGGAGGALGYYGSFFDTTIQTNVVGGNTGIAMTYNTTSEANGISIVDNSKITFEYGAVYNLQFSAQFDKTDSGTDVVDVWLAQNGEYLEWTNTRLTSVENNDKFVAAWNFMITVDGGDYLELYWASSDVNMRIYAEASGTSPYTRPGIPSVILTVQQVMFTQLGPTGPAGLISSISSGTGSVVLTDTNSNYFYSNALKVNSNSINSSYQINTPSINTQLVLSTGSSGLTISSIAAGLSNLSITGTNIGGNFSFSSDGTPLSDIISITYPTPYPTTSYAVFSSSSIGNVAYERQPYMYSTSTGAVFGSGAPLPIGPYKFNYFVSGY